MVTKIERILCPTDFSEESSEGLRYAVALARVFGAKLYVCHCAERASVAAAGSDRARAGRVAARAFEDALAPHTGLLRLCELDWEPVVIDCADAEAGVVREASARRVDLIVMRSRRAFGSSLLGSTAEALCRTAPCPVLVTHPRETEWVGLSAGEVDLRRVLVAYDFSDESELALQWGVNLAERFGAELRLVHVLPPREDGGPEISWGPGAAEGLYHRTVGRLKEAVPSELCGALNVTHEVRAGKPYKEILACAAEREIDLVCMGSDGADALLPALFGSNVDRVLRRSPCPVLVARPVRSLPA